MSPSGAFRGRHVLVCGGAGFIGSHIVAELLRLNARVTVLDPCVPQTGGRAENLSGVAGAVEWVRTRAENESKLAELVSETDFVFDAMGLTRHHVGIADPLLDCQLNYLPHLHLLNVIERTPKPLVYLGSRGQFGRIKSDVLDEWSPQFALDPQGIHKAAAESLMRIKAARGGLSVLSVRLENCFGPGQLFSGDDIGLIGGFIRALRAGESVQLYGDKKRSRNLAYGPDVAGWIVQSAAQIESGFSAVNMFGGEVRLCDLLDLLISLIGRGSYEIKPFPQEIASIEAGMPQISRKVFEQLVPDAKTTPLADAIVATLSYFDTVTA